MRPRYFVYPLFLFTLLFPLVGLMLLVGGAELGDWESLSGKWQASKTVRDINEWFVTVEGQNIEISPNSISSGGLEITGLPAFRGKLHANRVSGTVTIDLADWDNGKIFRYPFEGSVNDREIYLQFPFIQVIGAYGNSIRAYDGPKERVPSLVEN